ncbi:MAG: DUF357 domain-containing protein [Nanoarchaeota archaeon]
MKKSDKITPEKIEKYFEISKSAFKEAKEAINKSHKEEAETILDMASRYISDAEYFKKKEDLVNCFAALNYAHGWLDTGSKLGFFDVTNDKIFIIK